MRQYLPICGSFTRVVSLAEHARILRFRPESQTPNGCPDAMVEVADGAAILVIAVYVVTAYRRPFRARIGFVLTAISLLVTAVSSAAGLTDGAVVGGVVAFTLLGCSVVQAAWGLRSRPSGGRCEH